MPRFCCSACETELDRDELACPTCGCRDRHIYADVDSAIGIETSLGLKGRHGAVGDVRPYMEQSTKIRWNDDRQRNERCEIVVDRENDYYRQEWFDLETGECTFSKEGWLSDPDLHGKSARRGKPTEPPPEPS
jgi:hypothetical protein